MLRKTLAISLGLMLGLCLIVGVALADSRATINDNAPIYRMPRTDSSHLGDLEKGVVVDVLWTDGQIAFVQKDARPSPWLYNFYFIETKYLTYDPGSTPPTMSFEAAHRVASNLSPIDISTTGAGYAVVANPNPGGTVDLRATPSTDGKLLGKYYAGINIELLEKRGDWYYVKIGYSTDTDMYGWMKNDYLLFTFDPLHTPHNLPLRTVKAEYYSAPLTMSPLINSKILVDVPGGVQVIVIGEIADRYHVIAGNTMGYMYKNVFEDEGNGQEGYASYFTSGASPVIKSAGYAIYKGITDNEAENNWQYHDGYSRGFEEPEKFIGQTYTFMPFYGKNAQIRYNRTIMNAFAPASQFDFYAIENANDSMPHKSGTYSVGEQADGAPYLLPGPYVFYAENEGDKLTVVGDQFTRQIAPDPQTWQMLYLARSETVTVTGGTLVAYQGYESLLSAQTNWKYTGSGRIIVDLTTPDETAGIYLSGAGEHAAYRIIPFYEEVRGVNPSFNDETPWITLPNTEGRTMLDIFSIPSGSIIEFVDVTIELHFGNG